MTTGVPIYLVSACTTGEEFVAAFRRYADRGSLFVPIAEPIPAGRRGRFALTLAGGGVLIEGEAEVISSSKVPSILHGRVGMTIRFGELDDNSKTVLVELEKARLAARPPAPSVAPRVVELPAGPRPKPPAASVRIDASIALAECTALGDLETLEKTTAAPPKAGPKFVVPSVPPVGTPRPKTPSTPPELRPRTPSGPVPVVRPKTPSVPPPMPSLSPLPKSPSGPVRVPTTGLSATQPAVSIADLKPEKKPLDVALADAGAAIDGAKTTTMDVPPAPLTPRTLEAVEGPTMTLTPTQMAAVPPPPVTGQRQAAMTPTELSTVPEPTTTPPNVAPSTPESLLTTIRSGPPASMPSPGSKDWMLTTVRGTAPPPAAPVPKPPIVAAAPAPKPLEPDLDEPTDLTAMPIIPDDTGRKTSLGVTAIMREPAAMTPSAPLPLVPVPQVDPNDDAPVEIEDLDTSVTEQPDEVRSIPNPVEPPVVAAAKPVIKPTVEEPTPSGDWTITPGEAPKIARQESRSQGAPRGPEPTKDAELAPVAQAAEDTIAPPPTRITGNWTIQLDSSSPDGWSEPSKVDATALPAAVVAELEKPKKKKERTKPTPETPPELRPVARSIVMEALHTPPPAPVTPSEEPKVQIDPTLMEAPIVDPGYGASASMSAVPPPATLSALMPAQAPPVTPAQSAHALPAQSALALPAQAAPPVEHLRLATPIPGSMAPMVPIDRPTPSPIGVDPQLAPGRVTPVPGTLVAPPFPVSPAELVSLPTPPPGRMVTDGGVGFFRESGDIANLAGSGSFPVGDSTSLVDARRRRRLLVIGISAAVAVAVGIVLVIVLAGGGDKKADEPIVKAPADAAPVAVAAPDAAQVVVAPPDAEDLVAKDAAPIVEPATRCTVEVTSVPAGADVLVQGSKDVLGTTPATLELPCGDETRLLVRKARFSSAVRPVTPTEAGAKLRVALAKLTFSVKVSSSPAGASISVNGKSVAVTPTTMKLPAFETSTVTFSKDGYNVESQRVTPKQNNQTVHAQLKKKRR